MVVGSLLIFILWLLLVREWTVVSLAAGAAVTLIAVGLQRLLLGRPTSAAVFIGRPWRVVAFLFTLIGRLMTSTLYTCRLILFGGEEGRIIALPIGVDDPFAQYVLLHSITLTPSTISLLLDGDLLYIHWLAVKGSEGDWRKITGSLERRLRRPRKRGGT